MEDRDFVLLCELINNLRDNLISRLDKIDIRIDDKADKISIDRIADKIEQIEAKKMNRIEFEPYKSMLAKINRLVISLIIVAVIYTATGIQ